MTNKRIMFWVLIGSLVIMLIKFFAFYLTGSTAILTDALESIINVLAGSFALFSIYWSSTPRDENHPYGHGKMEFISAGFEGGLILLAGLSMVGKAIFELFNPNPISQLDLGIALTILGGSLNLIMSRILIRRGKSSHSLVLQAEGKHLRTDVYSTLALVIGLVVIYFTGKAWLDPVIAILFGFFILYTGFKLIRTALAGLLDEADYEVINELVEVLNHHRRGKWIDIHNLRLQKYGDRLHIDCHVTFPWYDNLEAVHKEVDEIARLANQSMGQQVEFFIHSDPCKPHSCPLCLIENCPVRKHPFQQKVEWTVENIIQNQRHEL